MTRRIDESEVAQVRNQIKAAQGNVCALCGLPFTRGDYPVLDHDHTTGHIRGVLHNTCNSTEGKVRYQARRGHKGVSEYDYLINLGKYLDRHREPIIHLIHPEHKTEEEKVEAKKEYMKEYRQKQKAKKKTIKMID